MVLIGLALLMAGLGLVYRGWRPPRRGDEPRCRACEYILTGMTSDRCPECGTELVRENIVQGQRVRSGWKIAVGTICLLLFALCIGVVVVPSLARIDWYQFTPTRWVLYDLESTDPLIASKALTELSRRRSKGHLSDAHRETLIEIVLDFQAPDTSRQTQRRIDLLGEMFIDGQLSDEQQDRFFRQMVAFSLEVRPIVVRGNRVPMEISAKGIWPAGGWWRYIEFKGLRVDGRFHGRRGSSSGVGNYSSSIMLDYSKLGSHEVEVECKIEIYHGNADRPSIAWLCHSRTVILSGRFNVVATDLEGGIEVVHDPSLLPQMEECITAHHVRLRRGKRTVLSGKITITRPPEDIAFELIGRVGEQELILSSSLVATKGVTETHEFRAQLPTGMVVEHLDLILRSSEAAVRETVHGTRLWKGEVVLREVPLNAK